VEKSKERAKYRAFVACVVMAGLFVNFFGYACLNALSWVGGPLALVSTMAYTVISGIVLWFLPKEQEVGWSRAALNTVILWPAVSMVLFFLSDPIQQFLWIKDTERVAREYGKGELPPGCEITGTYRANVHTPLECKGKVPELAAWYRERLGPEWKETKERREFTFTRSRPGQADQVVRVYNEFIYGHGTHVLVFPTQTN
jgi:hypothetical protein